MDRSELEIQFIRCRDALACAMEWVEPPEPPDVHVEISSARLAWLNKRLIEATVLADQICQRID